MSTMGSVGLGPEILGWVGLGDPWPTLSYTDHNRRILPENAALAASVKFAFRFKNQEMGRAYCPEAFDADIFLLSFNQKPKVFLYWSQIFGCPITIAIKIDDSIFFPVWTIYPVAPESSP